METVFRAFFVINIYCSIIVSGKVLKIDSSGIFDIPIKSIEDEELLEAHGRFMLTNMNLSINPCEDFYEFACGNWENDNLIPLMGRNQTFLGAMNVKINEFILGFLKNRTSDHRNQIEKKMKRFFRSCLDMSEDFNQAYETINNYLKEFRFEDCENLHRTNFDSHQKLCAILYFLFSVQYNVSSNTYEIVLDMSKSLTSADVTKIFADLKLKNEEAVLEEWKEVETFEKKLFATVTITNTSQYESIKNFLQTHNSSEVNFERFFDLAFNGTVDNSWKINYSFENFTDLFHFFENTNSDELLKYEKWRIFLYFYEELKRKNNQTREDKCRVITLNFFENTFIPWFIDIAFDQERRTDVLMISKRIKDTFYSFIDKTNWLDDETKLGAKSKLRALGINVGYTDDMRHRSQMAEKRENVNITKNFWENLINLEKNIERYNLENIGRSTFEWNIDDTNEANAAYDLNLNQVSVSIGITQLPLYHMKLPNSLKFGGIGYVIGHEIAHAIDSTSFAYDYDGKKQNWWSRQALRNFKERYRCLESQYNKFISNGMRLNGKSTSGENIADNVGLKIAYQSYLRFLDEQENLESGQSKPLPGLDFTNKQLFFLKFAQSHCDGKNAVRHVDTILNDAHSLGEFRVLGTLMNMPEFSEEFSCSLGSNMNPLKKCIIYGNE